MTLSFEEIGRHWEWSGELFTMFRGREQARVYVDSIGETWVSVHRIPEGGNFPTEQIEAYRTFGSIEEITVRLRQQGFRGRVMDRYAHRVRQKDA